MILGWMYFKMKKKSCRKLLSHSYPKGPSIKDVRSQGGRGLSSADKGEGGFFRCGRPHFLAKKRRIFRDLWFFRTTRGRGSILCERPLWTAPNNKELCPWKLKMIFRKLIVIFRFEFMIQKILITRDSVNFFI